MANKLPQITTDDVTSADTLCSIKAALVDTGGVLLRGKNSNTKTFERLSQLLVDRFHHVGIRQPVRQSDDDGYTTEVFQYNVALLGHSEGAYRPWPPPPDVCFFMCLKAPDCAGGETTLVDGVTLLERLDSRLRRRLEEGLIFSMVWEPERWRAEFGVSSEAELIAVLTAITGAKYELQEGRLELAVPAPAIRKTLRGDPSFANGLLAHLPRITHPKYSNLVTYSKPSNRVYFADGVEIDQATINHIIDIHDEVLIKHRWRDNGILILDNFRYMHGREMTAEPRDRILISRFGALKAIPPHRVAS